MQGIQSIQVVIANNSASHHLNPADLGEKVINSINSRSGETGVRTSGHKLSESVDAILKITVLSETAMPFRAGSKGTKFQVTISASLTRNDGQVMWNETSATYPIACYFAQEDSSNVCNEAPVYNWLMNALSNRIVYRMLYKD